MNRNQFFKTIAAAFTLPLIAAKAAQPVIERPSYPYPPQLTENQLMQLRDRYRQKYFNPMKIERISF